MRDSSWRRPGASLPAILLLLSERPGYGYGLVPRLQEFHFGHVDRPAVYRALASWSGTPLVEASAKTTAGQARRVYRITARGERVLRAWMGVIKDEHDYLGEVLRRYQATGTTDAVLAEIEGGWATALGVGWSPVRRAPPGGALWSRSTPAGTEGPRHPRRRACEAEASLRRSADPGPFRGPDRGAVHGRAAELWRHRRVRMGRSRGQGRTSARGPPPSGRIIIDVSGLRSGNGLYDAELLAASTPGASRPPRSDLRLRAESGRAPATTSRGRSPSTG